jgi:hypothetical protein
MVAKKPTTPMKITKLRGLAAKKANTNEPSVPEPSDFAEEIKALEKELNSARIGTFRVFMNSMTFVWSEGENRALASETQRSELKNSMTTGIYRMDANNRMSGVIDRELLEGRVFMKADEPTKLEDVKRLNEDAEYPKVVPEGKNDLVWVPIEMQSGHHRMTILVGLKKDPRDHWWLVTLYDRSMTVSNVKL